MTDEKIDLVYLWLDGNDEKVRNERLKWQSIESGKSVLAQEGVCDARWRENDELRYALRGADKFAPWINHIFIVTGFGQAPQWLDTSNPKITIVPQESIMPPDAAPVFNSIAVENCLANIPGLSERFLYANDDMFFGRETPTEYFFDHRGRPVVWYTTLRKRKSFVAATKMAYSEYHVSCLNSARLIKILFDKDYRAIAPSHNIEPYLKSTIKKLLTCPLIDMYYQKSIRRKFRNTFDLYRWAFSLYDLAFGRAVGRKVYLPKSKKHFVFNAVHRMLGHFRDTPQFAINAKRAGFAVSKPYLFCVNDTDRTTDQDKDDNKEFLRMYFPNKSQFEK
ncbi:MAG: hypothetical protein LBJ73_04295 [Rickettsiales bacterium]|jgi:hypothetical protein|nr:hypothetical protein [Rickettsiales bacterium]